MLHKGDQRLYSSYVRKARALFTAVAGISLPTTGRLWDFHPSERALTGRT